MKKLNLEQELEDTECKWLEQQKLDELIAIDRIRKDQHFFAELQNRYKANQYQCLDLSSQLFIILKNLEINRLKTTNLSQDLRDIANTSEFQISEKDIQWLSQQGFFETVKIAQDIHFKELKSKYRIVGLLATEPFYNIMLKLERGERLDPKQVVQLIEEGHLSPSGKIAIAYHRLEAIFFEAEHKPQTNWQ